MFSVIRYLKPDGVTDYYLEKPGVSSKHKKNLRRIKSNISNDASVYANFACSGEFHKVKGNITNVDEGGKKTLELLYNSYLKKSKLRKFIFKHSLRCVGCQTAHATERATLDHFLPSSIYPNFFVLPWNLIPTCGDCNRIKNDCDPITSSQNLPHPYFNAPLFKKDWLKVVLIQIKPLKFKIDVDDNLSLAEKQMVINHLNAYKLYDVFNNQIPVIFDERDEEFRDVFTNNGADNFKAFLISESKRVRIPPSRVKTYWPINIEYAFFSSLRDSDWFCNNYYI